MDVLYSVAPVEKHSTAIRSLVRANQRPGRRRLIKIARTRFGGIAAAAVGRFSTIRPSLSLSRAHIHTHTCIHLLILSPSLSSCSFLRIPRLTALLVALHPRGPCPFRTTQTRGAIRRGLRARHSDDRIRTARGMSNNIRAATVTDDEAAARNSAARFAFFFSSSSLSFSPSLPPPCRRVPARHVIVVRRIPRAPLKRATHSSRFPFPPIHISIVHQTRFDRAIGTSRFH